MKTYHQYQSESKQAEQKLSVVQQQLAKIKSAKKQKAMDKRVKKVRHSLDPIRSAAATYGNLLETNEIHGNQSESLQSSK